jgi:hypothetical protein
MIRTNIKTIKNVSIENLLDAAVDGLALVLDMYKRRKTTGRARKFLFTGGEALRPTKSQYRRTHPLFLAVLEIAAANSEVTS